MLSALRQAFGSPGWRRLPRISSYVDLTVSSLCQLWRERRRFEILTQSKLLRAGCRLLSTEAATNIASFMEATEYPRWTKLHCRLRSVRPAFGPSPGPDSLTHPSNRKILLRIILSP
jgi:hypothetical protein